MKKRIGGIFLTAVLVLTLLTACGGSAKVSNGSKSFAAGDSSAPMDMAPAAAEDFGGKPLRRHGGAAGVGVRIYSGVRPHGRGG